MTIRTRHIAVLMCTVGLAVAGCGSSKKDEGPGVPQATAAEIDKQLASLSERVGVRIKGACENAQDENIPAIQTQVADLPKDTDPDVKSALSESIDRLSSLLDGECRDIAAQNARENQDTNTTETAPPATETLPETVPQTDTQTDTTPTTPQDNGKQNPGQQKKDQKKQQDNGGTSPPNGNGNGGVVSP